MAVTAMAVPVIAVGVCGSDIQRLRDGFALASLGHELVGLHPADGTVVAIRPLSPCRSCDACRKGWTEQCPQDASIGRHDTRAGGFSGMVSAQPDQLYPLPGGLSTVMATLADPLACVLHALHGVELAGADVLVIGDGPMAALAAVHARRRSAALVTVAVKDASRIERMTAFCDRAVTAHDLPANRYDVVLESVGGVGSEPILIAVTAVAPLGQVVAIGVYRPQATADLPVRRLLEKESTLRGSKAYRVNDRRDDFATALELLTTQTRDFASIITATPTWTPGDPQSPALEPRHPLKTVYVIASRMTDGS
jgi:L-iditol 2-dehydrogenase